MPVLLRRVYDDPAAEEGKRVLVDRLWPRGLTEEAAHVDEWLKDVAPSNELRTWYGHDPERWEEFGRRYLAELGDATHRSALDGLREMLRTGPVTLLTATKVIEHSHAAILADLLGEQS
ncbi:DUF488 domain-containing protein [Sphaerisporangium corydalis]|uniref:DUF488 domain-containing protein n=1 Tax=Sphaerisporangium corydalis TaxID=1441875 RepID=A0ABV9E9P2_9ACTN|nr:DUF488 family protein [Sphaerisporangium corydalis]